MSTENPGATVVITHTVRAGKHADYEQWLAEVAALCKTYPGHLDSHVIRPIPGLTDTFTIMIRFDTEAHLKAWMESPDRRRLIKVAQPLLANGDYFAIGTGLDFLFAPGAAQARAPARWKQYLVTWSAIFPLATVVPLAVAPALKALGAPNVVALNALVATGIVVLLMVYVVMPRYTRLIQRWLYS
jgi:antibiotic biosynthesis monooxygenase (ABM) superfamily enzyme